MLVIQRFDRFLLCQVFQRHRDTQIPENTLSINLLIHPAPDIGDVGVSQAEGIVHFYFWLYRSDQNVVRGSC